jgi:hypothetical protein
MFFPQARAELEGMCKDSVMDTNDRRQGPRRASEQRAHLARELILEQARALVSINRRPATTLVEQSEQAVDMRRKVADLGTLIDTLDEAEELVKQERVK